MSKDYRRCYTCLNNCTDDLVSFQERDQDEVTYWEKLKTCINQDLIERDPMEICSECIDQLRISYKFRSNVVICQAILKSQIQEQVPHTDVSPGNQDHVVKEEIIFCEVKQETDSVCQEDAIDLSSEVEETITSMNNSSPTYLTGNKYDSFFNFDDIPIDCSSCDICDMKFNTKMQLRKHKARVHNKVFKHVCPHCSRRFKQVSNFEAHVLSHTGGKMNDKVEYSCRICEKKFPCSSQQKYHEEAHEKPPEQNSKHMPGLCPICGKTFSLKSGKRRHMNMHMGIRNFKCTVCNKEFGQRYHLMEHMRIHTGEKRFICESCGKKFSGKSSMDAHRRSKHGDKDNLSLSVLPKNQRKQKSNLVVE